MPSSSSRGGSSSKLALTGTVLEATCGVEKEVDGGAEPTSNNMKGIGFIGFGWKGTVGRR